MLQLIASRPLVSSLFVLSLAAAAGCSSEGDSNFYPGGVVPGGTGGLAGAGAAAGTGGAATGTGGAATGTGGAAMGTGGGSTTLPDNSGLFGTFPATVSEDYARGVYTAWEQTWVKKCDDGSLRVDWDTAGKTVSEGIGYGMLLAAAWGDRVTFDGLWAYYKAHQNQNGLMGWLGSCSGNDDSGAATDADLDVAMALLIADCIWNDGGYGDSATAVITALRTHVMKADGSHTFLCAGDNWGDDCCGNASYQAPGYYRVFGKHVGDEAYWNKAAEDSYYYLEANNNDTTGLVSDWMDPDTLKCDAKGWGDWHGWDASRVPWRLATDYIWWNNPTAQAQAQKIAAFVKTKGGVASTCQGYALDGSNCGGSAVTTFAGAFASTGIAVDQATADTFFSDLKAVPNSGYFNEILNALYFTMAAKRFTAGCY